MLAGRVSAGGVVSSTVTVKVPLAELPLVSVAVQFTVVLPSAKVLPEAGEQLGVTGPSIASLAVAVKLTEAPMGPVASAVMLAGRVSAGGVVSWTVTVKVPFAVLPLVSVAVQATVVTPAGNVAPETGVQATVAASSGSAAVTA